MAEEKKKVSLPAVEAVGERAKKIFNEKYRESYERDHMGMPVAIDIRCQ